MGMTNYGSDRQQEIYRAGVFGKKPDYPLELGELERQAKSILKPEAYDYLMGSAGLEETERRNRAMFCQWQIAPRMLRDVSQRDLSLQLFGASIPAPVLVAPVGVQSILHAQGELGTAKAAASVGVPFTLSTLSSHSIEQVAEAMGNAPRWFQLYWSQNHEIAASLVKRAEASGFGAIMVTLDTPMLGWRPRDLQHAYLPFMTGEGLANYFTDPVFRAMLASPPEEDPATAVMTFLQVFGNTALTWQDLKFLREQTGLPILLKGILHPDDAKLAVDHGVDGIVVSNHGGRQVDGALSSLEALSAIAPRVADQLTVLFDSGVRTGADAFKAIALGAKAVLYGRPLMWGLAVGGEEGVQSVLKNFIAEFDLTMALSGCASVSQIRYDLLVHAS